MIVKEKALLGILLLLLVISSTALITAISSANSNEKEDAKKAELSLTPEAQEEEIEDDYEEAEIEDEKEIPITGNALEQASAKALAYIGEGRVTDSEIGDEEGYYEIEITLNNGNQVDVHLDENFNILSTEYD